MTIFEKLRKDTKESSVYTPENEQEAWISIMFACMAVDNHVSEIEVDKMCRIVLQKNMFHGIDIIEYFKRARTVHKSIGSEKLILANVSKVSRNNAAVLFCIVIELLLADGMLGQKEKEIADFLVKSIALDFSTAKKIVEVLMIKNSDSMVIIE